MRHLPPFALLLAFMAATACAELVPIPGTKDALALGGRWIDLDQTPRAGWSGAYARFMFQGTDLAVEVGGSLQGAWGAVKVRLDGRTVADIPLAHPPGPVVVAEGLDPDREHLVELISRQGTGFALKQILGNRGASVRKPPARAKRIEFCGDSITEGLGVMPMPSYDKEANQEKYGQKALTEKAVQDAALSYAPLVAEMFGADFTMLAKSGIGVNRNLSDKGPNTTDAFPQRHTWWTINGGEHPEGYDWKTATPPPNLVVIFLGANDVRANPKASSGEFVESYRAFLATLRGAYPTSTPYLLVGKLKPDGRPDTSEYVRAVIDAERAAGREDLEMVIVGTGDAAKYEPDWTHPNTRGQRIYADRISAKIKEWQGWPVVAPQSPE